jgi:malate synthase
VLTPAAVAFVEDLTRRFRPRIEELLIRRRATQQRLNNGERLDFLSEHHRRNSTVGTLSAAR